MWSLLMVWGRGGRVVPGSVPACRVNNGVTMEWGPDGRHLLAATLAPRLRVDNAVYCYRHDGTLVAQQAFPELLEALWLPAGQGARGGVPLTLQGPPAAFSYSLRHEGSRRRIVAHTAVPVDGSREIRSAAHPFSETPFQQVWSRRIAPKHPQNRAYMHPYALVIACLNWKHVLNPILLRVTTCIHRFLSLHASKWAICNNRKQYTTCIRAFQSLHASSESMCST